jgi:hypothetical protein
MSDSMELQDISNVVESNLCRFDIEYENEFTNKRALQLLELAFDKYHFNHSGENRSPDGPQLLENTGFRLSPE